MRLIRKNILDRLARFTVCFSLFLLLFLNPGVNGIRSCGESAISKFAQLLAHSPTHSMPNANSNGADTRTIKNLRFHEPGRAFRLTSFTRFRDRCDTSISSGILTHGHSRFLNEHHRMKSEEENSYRNQSMRSFFAMKCHTKSNRTDNRATVSECIDIKKIEQMAAAPIIKHGCVCCNCCRHRCHCCCVDIGEPH